MIVLFVMRPSAIRESISPMKLKSSFAQTAEQAIRLLEVVTDGRLVVAGVGKSCETSGKVFGLLGEKVIEQKLWESWSLMEGGAVLRMTILSAI